MAGDHSVGDDENQKDQSDLNEYPNNSTNIDDIIESSDELDETIAALQTVANEIAHNDDEDDSDFEALDRQLDQLNTYLDVLEKKNDVLTSQLKDLLESNRQARQELNSLQTASTENRSPDDKNDNPENAV